jgi:hypothetical protein
MGVTNFCIKYDRSSFERDFLSFQALYRPKTFLRTYTSLNNIEKASGITYYRRNSV